MIDVPVRDGHGRARPSAEIADRMDEAIAEARSGRPPRPRPCRPRLQNGAHPALARRHRPASRIRHGDAITLVVDACQARITSPAIADYLGARARSSSSPAPNSWAALRSAASPSSPAASAQRSLPARPRPRDHLPPRRMAGRLARRGGAGGRRQYRPSAPPRSLIFELERFQRLALDEVTRVILVFHQAVREEIIEKTPAHRVAPYPPGEKETADTHPIEMRTLSTLDLSEFCRRGEIRGFGPLAQGDAGLRGPPRPAGQMRQAGRRWLGRDPAHRAVDADGGRALQGWTTRR